jgi:hypothetical protein
MSILNCAVDHLNHLLGRNPVAHDHCRISRWAQTQQERYEARAVPGPEALLGCDGLGEVYRRAVVIAAERVCGNNKRTHLNVCL